MLHCSTACCKPFLGDCPLALSQDSSLPCYICETTDNLLVSIHKPIQRIWDFDLVTEGLHQLLGPPQIMPRYARVEMMNSLKLQSAVEEVKPRGAVNIHRRSKHLLRE